MVTCFHSALYRLLVSASQDGKLIIWDSYTTNKVSHVFERMDSRSSLVFSLNLISMLKVHWAAREQELSQENT